MRKLVSLLLTVMMLVSCIPLGALAQAPITLQLWTSNEEVANNPDGYYLKKIKDDFGVDLDIRVRAVGGSDYMDWLNLSMMSGDEPEWLRDQAIGQGLYKQFVDEDLLLELDEAMIRENMPNYIAWTQKYPEIFGENALNLYKVDGKIYAIPDAKVDLATFCYMAFRKDWLEKLGYEKAPETLDEVIQFMRDATTKDPDGNGIDDTHGYLGITNSVAWGFSPFFGAYGVYPDLFYEKDGKVVYGNVEPETKQVLALLRDLYKEGVIDPEWVTHGFDQVMNKVVTGKTAVTWQNWLTIFTGKYQDITDIVPDAGWVATTGPIGPNGDQGIMNFNPLAGVGLMFTKKLEGQEDKLIKYMQVFDAILGDPAYYEAEIWGLEGTTFTRDANGDRVYAEGYDKDKLFKFGVGADYRFPSLELFGYEPSIHDGIEFNKETLDLRAELIEMSRGKYNIMGGFVRPVWNEKSPDLPDGGVVFTDIILGNAELDAFDAYVEEWYLAGGTEILSEAQAIYDTYLK